MESSSGKITEGRERELLGAGLASEAVSESSRAYVRQVQDESLEGLPDYLRYVYIVTDYLGITSADQRLSGRIRKSDQSCIKQRVLIAQYEKKISQQEQLISDKEAELRDCVICFEKRKAQIEEESLRIEKLEEERQEQRQRIGKAPYDDEASRLMLKADEEIMASGQRLRRYEREKNEFAAKIIEAEAFVSEAENVLVSVQVYSSALHRNYLRSRIERMRLAPLVGMGKRPIETIDLIVEDQRIAEGTGRLADAMTLWVGSITEQIAGMQISPRERTSVYSELRRNHSSKSNDLVSMAERIAEGRRKGKYV